MVVVSIIILVALFSIQKFGTGKVGFMFAPVLALWFFSLGSIGIYNLVKYDLTVIRALNPAYIYLFFKKNSNNAWSALGGCVLCVTGMTCLLLPSCYPSTFSLLLFLMCYLQTGFFFLFMLHSVNYNLFNDEVELEKYRDGSS